MRSTTPRAVRAANLVVVLGWLVGLSGCSGADTDERSVTPNAATPADPEPADPEPGSEPEPGTAGPTGPTEPATPSTEGFAWEPLVGAQIELDVRERWGVLVDVDDTAQGRYESPYDRYVFTTPHCSDYCIMVTRVGAPAPSLLDARREWDGSSTSSVGGEPAVSLEEGTSPTGIAFSARRFTVRMGFPSIGGSTVHHLSEVSRFFAAVPLDAAHHLSCVGYVEHAAEIEDPAMQAARAACMSLRSAP